MLSAQVKNKYLPTEAFNPVCSLHRWRTSTSAYGSRRWRREHWAAPTPSLICWEDRPGPPPLPPPPPPYGPARANADRNRKGGLTGIADTHRNCWQYIVPGNIDIMSKCWKLTGNVDIWRKYWQLKGMLTSYNTYTILTADRKCWQKCWQAMLTAEGNVDSWQEMLTVERKYW